MGTIKEHESRLSEILAQKAQQEEQRGQALAKLEDLESTIGDSLLAAKDGRAATKAGQDLLQARVAVEVIDKTLAALERQEQAERCAIFETQAVGERVRAAATKTMLEAHNNEVANLVSLLGQLEGEYIPKPPPTLSELIGMGPRPYKVPKSQQMLERIAQHEAAAAKLEQQAAALRKNGK